MSQNFPQLNHSKTEILVFAPDQVSKNIVQHLGSSATNGQSFAKKLGVTLDYQLRFDEHIKTVIQSCYFDIRNIPYFWYPLLFLQQLEMMIHSFVSSHLDYCNALHSCLSHDAVSWLQLVQKSAARLLSKTSYHTHITPVLMLLHWLLINFRLGVSHSGLQTWGDCAFAVLGPRLWSGLPQGVRSANSLEGFKSQLKTYLFAVFLYLNHVLCFKLWCC